MQVVDLQYAPNGIEPVIRVSQFDTGRQFQLRIFDGVTPYVMPEGTVARIDGLKPDKTGFSYIDAVSVNDNIVTVTTQDQMTVLSGIVECEIRFIQGANYIGTLNFKLNVEESPINGDTDMSETDIPAIVELASIQEVNSEAWATGKKNGVDVPSGDETYHNNARYYADEAETAAGNVHSYAEDSEAWAVGEREGTPVTSEDETYHNNAKYYAGNASDSATSAAASKSAADTSAETSEAYAVGTRNGTAVTSGDVAYHNNSKYYAEEASTSAGNASTSETNAGLSESAAAQSEEDAEAWAVGTRNGVAVSSTDPTYHNNAKYYADEAGGAVNDMQGATSSTDGAHGLAPQPLAGDNEKFLRGDGTWSDVPAGLSSLEDVDLTNIADGQLLRYNGTAQKWENIGVDSTPTANSTKPVTSGGVKTQIDSINANKTNQTIIATRQANLTAVKPYAIDEQFIYNNTLYKATAAIAENATITIGGNATTADNISSQISNLTQRYGITAVRTAVNLAVCDGISNLDAYLNTARNSITNWLNNLDSNTYVHFDRLRIGAINFINGGNVLLKRGEGYAVAGASNFVTVYIFNGILTVLEAANFAHFYEITGSTFIDHGSEVPANGTVIGIDVTYYKNGK